jgi:hypothetical protein
MTINVANVTTAGNVIYPSVGNTAITYLALCNYSASNVTANIYVVPNGQTIANSNMLVSSLNIQANDTYFLYIAAEKIILANGDSIQANVSANTVTSTVSYTSI